MLDVTENVPSGADRHEFPPFVHLDGAATAGLLLICDHASNQVPPEYDLGLPAGEMGRHIAYDPGAEAVTVALARRLNAPAVLSTFSRLLIDANRGEDDPTLIMRLSDGAVIPGNAHVDAADRARRITRFHAPYHAAISRAIETSFLTGVVPVLLSIHSFTPVWRGKQRPWHAGVLWDKDPRLAVRLIDALRADGTLAVGDNEPYAGALANDTMYRHATRRGLAHALIEIRQDLIADGRGVADWADRIERILSEVVRVPELHEIRHHGSLAGPVDPIYPPRGLAGEEWDRA
jgi:predicted N-formylglutamate amidohydrolase